MSEHNLEMLFGPARDDASPDPDPHPHPRPVTARISGVFRLPGHADPAPGPHRLAGMCAWAAVLGLVGVAIALRALVAIMTGVVPHWFEPAVIGTGVAGITLTVGGFMAVHQRHLPWALLGAASATLVLNVAMTVSTL
jgi:hypothetical protein